MEADAICVVTAHAQVDLNIVLEDTFWLDADHMSNIKLCKMLEKGSYAKCEQRTSRSASASVQSDLYFLCSPSYTTVSIDSVSGTEDPDQPAQMRRFMQADNDLRCPPIAQGPFSCVAHHYHLM